MRILIAGGGIGGLSAAIALRAREIDAAVFERASEFREVGAGIMLAPNAIKSLDSLGLGDSLRACGDTMRQAELRSWTGRLLSRVPMNELARRYGAPTLCIHRADLQRILLEAAGSNCVFTGRELAAFEEAADLVSARFTNGQNERGDALVGADGIASQVRRQLLGDEAPRYAGYTVWRGIAPNGAALIGEGLASETHGRGTRFGMSSVGGGRVYWFAVANRVQGEPTASDVKADLSTLFGDYFAPIPALIESTPAGKIIHNDCVDRPPDATWGRGRVTLLGDAAHAMTPNLGQGACQAVEDAMVLAHRLASGGDVASGLRSYESARRPRTARIQRDSWRFGKIAHWENPFACWFRERMLAVIPVSAMQRRYDFLFGFDLPM